MRVDTNSQTLVGHIVADAKITVVNEKNLATFIIANNYYKRDSASGTDVSFFDVEHWNCKIPDNLKKGQQIIITGEIRQDRWINDAGFKKDRVKIIAHKIQLL